VEIMKKQKVIPRRKPGPAATGKGQPVVVRMHPPQLKALDAWIAQQKPPFPPRPEAVRRLVELALANSKKHRARYSEEIAAKAMELASKVIDGLMDPSASADEKADRKRRLFKGPSVFRDLRVDQPKDKKESPLLVDIYA
jgi:hypothetical protein